MPLSPKASRKRLARADDLVRQQYLIPRKSVRKLREISQRENISVNEVVRRAIESYITRKLLMRSDEAAAHALMKVIHNETSAALKRIDASFNKVRKYERACANDIVRAQARSEAKAWIEAHENEVGAIAELFGQDVGA